MNKKNIALIIFTVSISLIILSNIIMKYSQSHALHNALSTENSYQNTLPITHSRITEILDEATFEQAIKDEFPIVIKLYADWCGGCQYVQRYFPTLVDYFKDHVHFYEINADNKNIMNTLKQSKINAEPINYLPTFLLIKDGKVVKQIVGTKEFEYLRSNITETFNV